MLTNFEIQNHKKETDFIEKNLEDLLLTLKENSWFGANVLFPFLQDIFLKPFFKIIYDYKIGVSEEEYEEGFEAGVEEGKAYDEDTRYYYNSLSRD